MHGRLLLVTVLWLNTIRDLIAEKPRPFIKMVAGLKKFGGLESDGTTLKRMPRGFDENHVAAKWLKYQSFTAGRRISDSAVTSKALPATLEKEFKALLPLVRWLNGALGY